MNTHLPVLIYKLVSLSHRFSYCVCCRSHRHASLALLWSQKL